MKIEFVTSLIRHILTFGGGYLTTNGLATADDVTSIIGGVTALVGLIWSWVAKSPNNPIV